MNKATKKLSFELPESRVPVKLTLKRNVGKAARIYEFIGNGKLGKLPLFLGVMNDEGRYAVTLSLGKGGCYVYSTKDESSAEAAYEKALIKLDTLLMKIL